MAARKIELGPVGEHVRDRVATLRAERRLTLLEMANRLAKQGRPMADTAVSRIEQGERRVDADDLVALAAALGVDPVELLGIAPVQADSVSLDDALAVVLSAPIAELLRIVPPGVSIRIAPGGAA